MTEIRVTCPGCKKDRPTRADLTSDPETWRAAHNGYPCCNPLCRAEWGTGCYHCHHPEHWDTGRIAWVIARGRALSESEFNPADWDRIKDDDGWNTFAVWSSLAAESPEVATTPGMTVTVSDTWVQGRGRYDMHQVWTVTAPEPYGEIVCEDEDAARAWAELLNETPWRVRFREWCRSFSPDMNLRHYGWDTGHYRALKKGFRAGWRANRRRS